MKNQKLISQVAHTLDSLSRQYFNAIKCKEQGPENLINIETFQQYIINNRLVTVLGELHNNKSCTRPGHYNITPAQYIKYRIKQNPKHVKVLLEYFGDASAREFSKQQGLQLSQCGNLVQIAETIPKKYIKKTDARKILGINLGYLYTNEIKKISISDLNRLYLKPIKVLLEKLENYLKTHAHDYNHNELMYLYSYGNEKNEVYKYLLTHNISRQERIKLLQKTWIELADLDILKVILKQNNSIFEYIIIIGTAHSQHLYSIFSKLIVTNKKLRNGLIPLKNTLSLCPP